MRVGGKSGIKALAAASALGALIYFSPSEFAQKNDRSGDTAYLFDTTTAKMLDAARDSAGIPFILNSAVRTPKYNESVGGARLSSHSAPCYCGVDIATYGRKSYQNRIVDGLEKAGFIRIIIYPRHIHADTDSSKPTRGVWYSSYKK